MSNVIYLKDKGYLIHRIQNALKDNVNGSIGRFTTARTSSSWESKVAFYDDKEEYIRDHEGYLVPKAAIAWPPGLKEYIHRCISVSCNEIIESLYTQEDFDKDIGLNK